MGEYELRRLKEILKKVDTGITNHLANDNNKITIYKLGADIQRAYVIIENAYKIYEVETEKHEKVQINKSDEI